jgi:hypothetical protein
VSDSIVFLTKEFENGLMGKWPSSGAITRKDHHLRTFRNQAFARWIPGIVNSLAITIGQFN